MKLAVSTEYRPKSTTGLTDEETDETNYGGNSNGNGTVLSLIGDDGTGEGVDGSENVRRSRETEGESAIVSSSSKNDGKEVGKGVTVEFFSRKSVLGFTLSTNVRNLRTQA